MLPQVSRTFHGRDIFAPAAAHLATGMPPARFGKLVHDAIRSAAAVPVRGPGGVWTGCILKVDRFGNLITNLHLDQLPDIRTRPFEWRAGRERIARLALNYAETEIGDVFVIIGSSGYLEVAANQDSAARQLGCGAGAEVQLQIF